MLFGGKATVRREQVFVGGGETCDRSGEMIWLPSVMMPHRQCGCTERVLINTRTGGVRRVQHERGLHQLSAAMNVACCQCREVCLGATRAVYGSWETQVFSALTDSQAAHRRERHNTHCWALQGAKQRRNPGGCRKATLAALPACC